MSDGGRYAKGQREEAECRKCGQPIWIVYHGPQANHTVEGRAALELEQAREALREAEWNVTDGFDPDSAVIVKRSSWRRLQEALASGAVQVGDGQDNLSHSSTVNDQERCGGYDG